MVVSLNAAILSLTSRMRKADGSNTQTRTFEYNAKRQLLTAKNPENGPDASTRYCAELEIPYRVTLEGGGL